MIHSILGEIEYEYLWQKKYVFKIFGEENIGLLQIAGDADKDVEQIQIDSYEAFELHKQELSKEIEVKLYNYYCSISEEYRDRYGDDADFFVPKIDTEEEMKTLVKFETLNIPYIFDDQRVVGILFKAKWEPEHGVGVKIINEEIVEIGYQDIVL